MTNATLSPLEQKIYFAAKNAKDGVIFLEIMRSWKLTDDRTLLATLSRMVKKGWLIRLRKGIYLVSNPAAKVIPDAFVLSTYIFPGYNAFSAALYLHKLTDMLPFEIFVATRNESGSRTIGEYSFRAVALRKRAIGSELKQGYRVSTIAKTLYDCLCHPEFAGGYPSVLKAIYEAKLSEKDWAEFFYYVEKFERSAFYQRLGYLLDILPEKSRLLLKIVQLCKKKVRSKVYLFGRRKGKYIQRWRLIDNIGKEELLSWWY